MAILTNAWPSWASLVYRGVRWLGVHTVAKKRREANPAMPELTKANPESFLRSSQFSQFAIAKMTAVKP